MIRAATAAPVTTLQVVVVASDAALRLSMKETLAEHFGHRIVGEGASGTEMVRTVLAAEPDLVVFDLHLPYLSGPDALRQVREQIPVAAVAIAENRDQESICALLTGEVQACLIKPVAPVQLQAAVLSAWARFTEARRLQEEAATLRRTLENRKVIERTKGVLMKRFHWSEAEAYRRLQRGAMNGRTTMAELAQAVLNGSPVDL